MASATTTANVPHPEIPAHDPAHDIDGKLTAIWLIGSAVFVFVTVWLLYFVYTLFLFQESYDKVETAPTEARAALSAEEEQKLGAGEDRIPLDEAMRRYVESR